MTESSSTAEIFRDSQPAQPTLRFAIRTSSVLDSAFVAVIPRTHHVRGWRARHCSEADYCCRRRSPKPVGPVAVRRIETCLRRASWAPLSQVPALWQPCAPGNVVGRPPSDQSKPERSRAAPPIQSIPHSADHPAQDLEQGGLPPRPNLKHHPSPSDWPPRAPMPPALLNRPPSLSRRLEHPSGAASGARGPCRRRQGRRNETCPSVLAI